jgi:hypothetical protein
MHIQIRSALKGSAFTDDNDGPAEGSITLGLESLSDLLGVLAQDDSPDDPAFSLAAASGHHIEIGGRFTFWVHPRPGIDDDHEQATLRALKRINDAGYDADAYTVESKHLSDRAGTLKEFVDEVSAKGLHIVEISVGVPGSDGIPVQIFTAQTR